MKTEEFVNNIYLEKEKLLRGYFTENNGASVNHQLAAMNLTLEQKQQLHQVMDTALTDLCFTLLTGLDGATALGAGNQQSYTLFDEAGNELIRDGAMEAVAYDCFYENKH